MSLNFDWLTLCCFPTSTLLNFSLPTPPKSYWVYFPAPSTPRKKTPKNLYPPRPVPTGFTVLPSLPHHNPIESISLFPLKPYSVCLPPPSKSCSLFPHPLPLNLFPFTPLNSTDLFPSLLNGWTLLNLFPFTPLNSDLFPYLLNGKTLLNLFPFSPLNSTYLFPSLLNGKTLLNLFPFSPLSTTAFISLLNWLN